MTAPALSKTPEKGTEAAIRFSNLTLGYDRKPAVHHMTGSFRKGSMTALVGPNGGGKSTLLKGIVGLMSPLSGQVSLDGLCLGEIAYLPQAAEIDRSFPLSVVDVVSLGLWRRVGGFRSIRGENYAEARRALSAVGLEGFEHRPIGSLSGGQLQRTLFARLLLQDSPVILLDEPFTAIDQKTTADLLDLVARWNREGRTVIAALHDLDQVRAHFPETCLLAREPIAWGPTGTVLSPANLLRARRFTEAWIEGAPTCEHDEVPRHDS